MIRQSGFSFGALFGVACVVSGCMAASASAAGADADAADADVFASYVRPFFASYCVGCHGPQKQKGKLTLHDLAGPDAFEGDAERWERVLEAISLRDMPPEDEKQPTGPERSKVVGWINARFDDAGHTTEWSRKLLFPEHGNAIDHDRLFDGSVNAPAYTPSRLWKKSPYIFDSMVSRGLGIAKPKARGRDRSLADLKQPFTLEDKEGIKDYAAIVFADSATLGTLLRNAEVLVDKYLEGATYERQVRDHGPTPAEKLPKDQNGKPIPPRYAPTPDAFKAVVLHPGSPTDEQIDAALSLMYDLVVERVPSPDDLSKHRAFMRRCITETNDNAEGLRVGLVAVAISPEAIFRTELGRGEPDQYGRRMLGAADLAYAIAYALTDEPPDPTLMDAARSGRLESREDVAREVARIWDDAAIDKPRILRFFHEFFGYDRAPGVFKDESRFGGSYRAVPQNLVDDADMLVNYIVRRDKNVLAELLTTEEYFVAHSGNNEQTARQVAGLDAFYEHFKGTQWQKIPYNIGAEHREFFKSEKNFYLVETHPNGSIVRHWMDYMVKCKKAGINPVPNRNRRSQIVAYGLDHETFDYPIEQPFVLERGKRAGILMHPAWLIAHSLNLDNDPVRRGKWVRERLLADSVPALPITVDASIPDEPDQTLRHRFRVTRQDECWRCHVKMNPLGMTFECFDDFGRYRTVEKLHAKDKTAPVDATGSLDGTGDPALDGDVRDAYDMVHRLAKSQRVRQSFVRHAFRYWMGRNEMYSDSGTLIAADRAYVDNGGSLRALVLSLLTSDSFLYRKPSESSP